MGYNPNIRHLQGYDPFTVTNHLPSSWDILELVEIRLSESGETFQLSNEKRAPGWLGKKGDEILPTYMGAIRSHCKDPY